MKKTGTQAYLIYLAVRTVMALIQTIPVNISLQFARTLSRGWLLLTKRHRDRAIEHLEASFGDEYSRAELEHIAEESLAHWTMFAMEVAWSPRLLSRGTWTQFVDLVDFDEALELLLGERGAILVSGHYGQFELTGYLMACLGIDLVAVMRPLDNEYLNRYLVESRESHGLKLLDKRGATTEAAEIVGRGGSLGLVADQDAGARGVFVDFFGRPASTYKSIGLLAMQSRVPIIVGYCRRVGDKFHYEVGVSRIVRPEEWESQDDPLRWITQAYTSAIEASVREKPEQYLWMHRRWKTKPGARRKKRRVSE